MRDRLTRNSGTASESSDEAFPGHGPDANRTGDTGSAPMGTGPDSVGTTRANGTASNGTRETTRDTAEATPDRLAPVPDAAGSGAIPVIGSAAMEGDGADTSDAHGEHPDDSLPGRGAARRGMSPGRSTIPDIVIRRLPIYVRTLRTLAREDVASVSSEDLADRIGVTAAQIRRDLSYFGRFGTQGKGYETGYLAEAIARILRLDRQWDVALAGLGNLGRAIVNYRGFGPSSFDVVALFDANPAHVGEEIAGLPVYDRDRITEEVRARGIKIGIVAVRAPAAQDITDRMVAGGIRAILNYAPVVLKVPPGVTVREIDPVSALQSMTYYIDRDEVSGDTDPSETGEDGLATHDEPDDRQTWASGEVGESLP